MQITDGPQASDSEIDERFVTPCCGCLTPHCADSIPLPPLRVPFTTVLKGTYCTALNCNSLAGDK